MITALKIERRYGKREILEAYLNTVSFHYNAFGIEMPEGDYTTLAGFVLVLAGLAVLSIVVGIAMSALNIEPANVVQGIRTLVHRVWELGFGVFEGVLGYLAFLAVAVLYEPYFTATQGRTPGKKILGAVGVSGDTSCADHNIGWRVRALLGLDHLLGVPGVATAARPDNIIFDITTNPAGGTGVSTGGFGHPHCLGASVDGDPTQLPAVSK